MAIQKITIGNFTVFDKIEIDFCNGVNVFIGENGTGKTHLLKLLYQASELKSTSYLHSLTSLFGRNFIVGDCELLTTVSGEADWTPLSMCFYSRINKDDGSSSQINYVDTKKATISIDIDTIKPTIFIPAKEVLSMANITRVSDEYKASLDLDVTLTEIIKKAINLVPDNPPTLAIDLLQNLEGTIGGTVDFDEKTQSFWVLRSDGSRISFNSEAEGYRKLGLLWQLIMNKSITNNCILFWDEPEANLNPNLIPIVVDILLELARNGVQIFLATHDYVFAKYFEVRRKNGDAVLFHSLFKSNDGVKSETNQDFRYLNQNPIIEAFDALMDEVLGRNMGD